MNLILRRSAFLVCLASLLSACDQNTDLAVVRALSQQVADAAPSYAAIADDYYQSCLRIVGWEMTGKFHLATPPSAEPKRSGDPAPTAEQQKAIDAARAAQLAAPGAAIQDLLATYDCDGVKKTSEQWEATNNILTSYFAALGAAAGDDSKVDFGFSQLATAAGNDGIVKPDQGKASANFASDLAKAIFAAKRRSLTADQAKAAKDAIAFYVGRLSAVAASYSAQLNLESDEINSFYSQNFVAQSIGLQTLETIRYRTDWKAALEDINVHRTAEAAYVKSLKSLKEGNDNIADAAVKNDFATIVAAVGVVVTELKPDILAMQKAFK